MHNSVIICPLIVSDELGYFLGALLLLLFLAFFVYAIWEQSSLEKSPDNYVPPAPKQVSTQREKKIEHVKFLRDKYPDAYNEWFGDGSYLAGLSDEEIEKRLAIAPEIWEAKQEAFRERRRIEQEKLVQSLLRQQEEKERKAQIEAQANALCKLYPHAVRARFGQANVLSYENAEAIIAISKQVLCEEENRFLEENRRALEEIKRKCQFLQTNYPHAFELIKKWRANGETIDDIYTEHERVGKQQYYLCFPRQLASIPEEIYQKYEAFRTEYYANEEWFKKQFAFSQAALKLKREEFADWGGYTHQISFDGHTEKGAVKKYLFRVLQVFTDRFCLSDNLDYTFYPQYKDNRKYIPMLLNCQAHYKDVVYERLVHYLTSIDGLKTVLIADSGWGEKWGQIEEYHFATIIRVLLEKGINVSHFRDLDSYVCEPSSTIVILELVTNNKMLNENCKSVLSQYCKQQPQLIYLSLDKEFDETEFCAMNDLRRAEIQREEDRKKKEIEEQERKEQERLQRIKAEQLAKEEQERKERERLQRIKAEQLAKEEQIKKEQQLLTTLSSKVDFWESLWNGLKISYLMDYYPTTVDFQANEKEWEDRRTVWNFKNEPRKISETDHQLALRRVIPAFVDLLNKTFGRDNLKYLTLVCIPASTHENNISRYKEFSERLCQETGMKNGYAYTNVVRDRVAKRLGGQDSNVNYSFDNSFFSGKRVILLDDIITVGNSMSIAKSKLEQLGAKVICGISVGKTRHERRG